MELGKLVFLAKIKSAHVNNGQAPGFAARHWKCLWGCKRVNRKQRLSQKVLLCMLAFGLRAVVETEEQTMWLLGPGRNREIVEI